ncbi:DNRLRE domain-containing protein, partial [bacterium]|nr:DNRLRE domain-containing protein [bacterium]
MLARHRPLAIVMTLLGLAASAQAVTIILDNDYVGPPDQQGTVTFTAGWSMSTGGSGFIGPNYRHDGNAAPSAGLAATYTPDLPNAGDWLVEARWREHANRADDAPYTINYSGGSQTVDMNQRIDGGAWNALGSFTFDSGTGGNVELRSSDTGYVIADALRFTWVEPLPPGVLGTIDDAHIQGGGNAGTSFGDRTYLQVKRPNGGDFSSSRKAYMKFATDELSVGFDVATDLVSAELQLPFILGIGDLPTADAEATFRVYGILTNTWDEGAITWNNAPDHDTGSLFEMAPPPGAQLLGTFSTLGTAAGETLSFSSPLLLSFIEGSGIDDLLSLVITRETPES